MKICITGGAGYVGTQLTTRLLNQGHRVTVLDTFWYGDHLPKRETLRKIKGDIRDRMTLRDAFKYQDVVIHLACVSNDPSFDMNPELGRSINLEAFYKIIDAVKNFEIKQFIYASSSSVYGVSNLDQVTEDADKTPLTDYSKFKLECEEYLKRKGAYDEWTIVRPATVCGYSDRQRLDLVVNILTIQALVNGKITLFGEKQKRPNINIIDMCRAYEYIIGKKEFDRQVVNVGFENLTLREIANLVQETLKKDIEIEVKETNDPRSYHINSDKIQKMGFMPVYNIGNAIRSIKIAYEGGAYRDPLHNPEYYNIKQMKELGL